MASPSASLSPTKRPASAASSMSALERAQAYLRGEKPALPAQRSTTFERDKSGNKASYSRDLFDNLEASGSDEEYSDDIGTDSDSDEELKEYLASLSAKKSTSALPSPLRNTKTASHHTTSSPTPALQYLKAPSSAPEPPPSHTEHPPVTGSPRLTPAAAQPTSSTTSLKKMISFSRIGDAKDSSGDGSTSVLQQREDSGYGTKRPLTSVQSGVAEGNGDESSVGSDFEAFVRSSPSRPMAISIGTSNRADHSRSNHRSSSDEMVSGIKDDTGNLDKTPAHSGTTRQPSIAPNVPTAVNTTTSAKESRLNRVHTMGDLESESDESSVSEDIEEDVNYADSISSFEAATPPRQTAKSNISVTPPPSVGRTVDEEQGAEKKSIDLDSISSFSGNSIGDRGEIEEAGKKGNAEHSVKHRGDSRPHASDLLSVSDLFEDSDEEEPAPARAEASQKAAKETAHDRSAQTKQKQRSHHSHQHSAPPTQHAMQPEAPTNPQPPLPYPYPAFPSYPYHPYPPPLQPPSSGYGFFPPPYPYYPCAAPAWSAPSPTSHTCRTCGSPSRRRAFPDRNKLEVHEAQRPSHTTRQGGKPKSQADRSRDEDARKSIDEISERIEAEEESLRGSGTDLPVGDRKGREDADKSEADLQTDVSEYGRDVQTEQSASPYVGDGTASTAGREEKFRENFASVLGPSEQGEYQATLRIHNAIWFSLLNAVPGQQEQSSHPTWHFCVT
ncbi:hypothetical protein HK097_007785 [Rhizophlyctis rosea]|uniref:Uncharacterized protein n=1 Tax=Rhizophlyctis rosea TaxID=64517 RepID=A0AAD5SQA1_9FUNG|nr:hypothetical protein HK097_007785 [Rhizophlyctis rosea]